MSSFDWSRQVTEFNTANGYPPPLKPHLPLAPSVSALRLHLMIEELGDISRALNENDVVKLADGICDMLYVVIGTAVEAGLGPILHLLFDEVHRSNMTKDLGPKHEGHRGAVKGSRFEPPQLGPIVVRYLESLRESAERSSLPCCPANASDVSKHNDYCPRFQ